VNVKNMRKMFALAMVALLALTLAVTVVGCAQQAQETPAATETPAAESTPPADGAMTSDTTMTTDTTATH